MLRTMDGFYTRHKTFWRGLASLVVGVLLWEIAARYINSPLIVVPPTRVFYAFLALVLTEPVRMGVGLAQRRRPAQSAADEAAELDPGVVPSGARRVPRRHDETAPRSRGRLLAAVSSGGRQS